MGTRGLIGFIIKGKRVGSYNHWASYPDGLGKVIMTFLMSLSDADKAKFQTRLEQIIWVDGDDTPSDALQQRYAPLAALEPDTRHNFGSSGDPVPWSTLLHPVAFGRALPLILNGELDHLTDDTDFAVNGFCCEYAYYIDMDKEMLVVDGLVDGGLTIPFADFKEGLKSDLRAYGAEKPADKGEVTYSDEDIAW